MASRAAKKDSNTVNSLRTDSRLNGCGRRSVADAWILSVANWISETQGRETNSGGHAVALVGYDDDQPDPGTRRIRSTNLGAIFVGYSGMRGSYRT